MISLRALRALVPPSRPLVGIDIGSSAVKAVEVRTTVRGRVLQAVGAGAVPSGSIVDGAIVDPAGVAAAVRAALAAGGIRGRAAAAALPGAAVVVKRVTVPLMDAAELAGAIAWEAERHIPFDLRDVNLDYRVTGAGAADDDPAAMAVLLVAAKKNRIAEYAAALRAADCEPVVIDVGAFALQNVCEANGGLDEHRVSALLDVGASAITVNIVRGRRSIFTRDVPAGGNACSEAIRTEHGLSFEAAERLKRGLPGDGGGGGGGGIDVAPIMQAANETLLLEVRKTFDFLAAGAACDRIDRIVLTGGASRAAGLADALARRCGMPVEPLDPFRRIAVGGHADRVQAAGGPAALAVAAGLALRRGRRR